MLTVGSHDGIIISTGLNDPNPGKALAVVLVLQVDGGPFAGEEIAAPFYISETAIKNTRSKLRQLGWTGEDLSDTVELQGKKINFTVKEEEYNGNVSLKVAWVNLRRRAMMDPARAKEIGARLIDTIRKLDAAEALAAGNNQPRAPF